MTPEPNEQITQITALSIPEPPASPRTPLREMLATLKDTDPALLQAFARDIIEREVAVALYDQDGRLARNFARSGFFDAIKGVTPDQAIAQAMTIIQLGRSWNMQPSDAMQHLYFVKGRPAIQNEYMAAKMRDAGLDWEIEWTKTDAGEVIGCTLWPSRLGTDGKWEPIMERVNGAHVPASVSFTKVDADRVKIKEDGAWIALSEKSTYKAWMADMLFWRCIARLRRRYCTNILSGMLTRDEAEEIESPTAHAALSAPKPMTAPTAEMAPATEARKRAPKTIVEQPAPQQATPAPAPAAEPVATTEPAPSTPVPDQTPAPVETAPAFNRTAVITELREIRAKADAIGEGLFGVWLTEVDPELKTPIMDLPDNELLEHVAWLKAQSEKKWRKGKDGWVRGLF